MMITVIGMATFPGREPYLKKALESLKGQADNIRIYDNGIMSPDLTDNGKFYFLQEYKQPVYYLSCDDDILYPPTYVRDMVEAIDRLGTIVTHHGRDLLSIDRSYYKGHRAYRCTGANDIEKTIDVAGTGVTGFRTDYFNPLDLWRAKEQRMSDLVFSLEAAKQERRIILLPHPHGYIRTFPIPMNKTIHGIESRRAQTQQIQLANEIFRLNHLNKKR